MLFDIKILYKANSINNYVSNSSKLTKSVYICMLLAV